MKSFITKYIVLFSCSFIFFTGGYSQTITVRDKSDLQPISEVVITNAASSIQVTTNRAGVADLSKFNATDILTFTHVAFQPLQVAKSSLPAVDIFLTENIIKLDEFVLTGNRTEERRSDLPYKMEVIQLKDISFNNPQNAAIMLEQTGNVFVQTSQMGGGSPVLRGLEANKVLLVVDGVRMNNAIYRAGHLQNVITVDPFGLGSTEILYGPGSTLYGSDALGGVINFITKDPELALNGKPEIHGSGLARFSSANLEKTVGVHLNVGAKKIAALLNFSYSDFDDLRQGKVHNPAYSDFGQRYFYADRMNGKDTTVANDKPWIQKQSAYHQYNFLGKVLFEPVKTSRYIFSVQFSNSGDIPRYDRLTEMKNDSTMKFAEWYYGPQSRLLTYLKAEFSKPNKVFDKATFTAAWQNIHEDRIQRDFGKVTKNFKLETVDVFSLNADFDKRLSKKDELHYGAELTYNIVNSEAHRDSILSGKTMYNLETRYPDDKGNMMYLSAYASNKWNINEFLNFSQGLRLSYVTLNAAYSDTMVKIMKIRFDPNISQQNTALSGYLGLIATPGKDWKFSLIGSTGFRAPNIDDLTKLNALTSSTIVMPNPDLKPEYTYNLEFSVAKTLEESVRLEVTGYYNWLRDVHVIRPLAYNGQDSILIDGDKYQTLAPVNAGNAYILGLQGNLLAQVTRSFSILSNITYTYGYNETESVPLDHIPPVYGMTSFRLELQKFKGDFYVQYNGWKRISQYSLGGEDNEQYATPYGMPSWYTLNLKLSYQPVKYLNIEAGMENILDENYRKFASGISNPGRNVIASIRACF